MDEQDIIRDLQGKGYQKVYVWKAEPKEKDPKHKHPFDTHLYVLHGELEVRMDNSIIVMKIDDELDIPRNTIHEAKAGPDGCTYIVGERH